MIRRADGTVFTDELAPRELAAVKTVRWVWDVLNTPVSPFYYRQAAREMSSGNNLRQLGQSATDYDSAKTAASPALAGVDSSEAMTAEAAPSESADPFGGMADQMKKLDAKSEREINRDLAQERGARQKSLESMKMMAQSQAEATISPERPADQLAAQTAPAQPNLPPGADQSGSGAAGAPLAERRWAEQGLASLVIDFQIDRYAPQLTFRSLGVEPRISAVAVESRRTEAAAWGVGMLVFLIGVGTTRQPARKKCAYIITVMLASTVPLLITRQLDEVGQVFDFLFYAAALLVPYYLLAAIGLSAWNWLTPRMVRWFESAPAVGPATTVTGILLAIALAAASSTAQAQQPVDVKNLLDLLPMLDPGGPVSVPKDAIIIPYDPERPEGLREATKVLVPYDKYVELWNR
ncbi:MAG: hypothetical protein WEH44_01710, partial [Pirellulaceae bacterium]